MTMALVTDTYLLTDRLISLGPTRPDTRGDKIHKILDHIAVAYIGEVMLPDAQLELDELVYNLMFSELTPAEEKRYVELVDWRAVLAITTEGGYTISHEFTEVGKEKKIKFEIARYHPKQHSYSGTGGLWGSAAWAMGIAPEKITQIAADFDIYTSKEYDIVYATELEPF